MNRRYASSWRPAPAFTLVEVVASLMLLGTLLVGLLTAHRQHTQQIRAAELRLEAIAAADELLRNWQAEGAWGSVKPAGQFKNTDKFYWKWTVHTSRELRGLPAAVGRLDVLATGTDEAPLVSVELLTNSVVIQDRENTR